MKIGLFVSKFPTVSETFIINQAIGILKRGHDVVIDATAGGDHDSHQLFVDLGCSILIERTRYSTRVPRNWLSRAKGGVARLGHWAWRSPFQTFDSLNPLRHGRRAINLSMLYEKFPASLERRQFDVIHCHFGPSGQRALFLRNLGVLQGPIITTFHGYDANLLPRMHGPRMYQHLFNAPGIFTVGSEFMRRRLLALGAPEDRIIKLAMGVDLSRFRVIARPQINDEFRVLTIARLVEVKGIEYGLRAIALIRSEFARVRYVIVGDGPLLEPLKNLARLLSIEDIVVFRGAMPHGEVIHEIEKSHLVLQPSIITHGGEQEGQCLAVAEAQAGGLPVIATESGAIPESLIAGITGILVPPRNPNALALAILQLSRNTEMRVQMGEKGRSFVEKKFNLEIQNDRLIELYKVVHRDFTFKKGSS